MPVKGAALDIIMSESRREGGRERERERDSERYSERERARAPEQTGGVFARPVGRVRPAVARAHLRLSAG